MQQAEEGNNLQMHGRMLLTHGNKLQISRAVIGVGVVHDQIRERNPRLDKQSCKTCWQQVINNKRKKDRDLLPHAEKKTSKEVVAMQLISATQNDWECIFVKSDLRNMMLLHDKVLYDWLSNEGDKTVCGVVSRIAGGTEGQRRVSR